MIQQSHSQAYIRTNLKRYMHPYVKSSTIYKTWKKPKYPSTDQWIKKDFVLIYNGILFNY